MALYTIFAWTAIVIAGGAYYWVYIRQAPLPIHLLGITSKPHSRESTAEGISLNTSQKRKRKATPSSKKRGGASQTNELFTGQGGISESEEETKSTQQVQDEKAGRAENKSLKG